MHKSIISILYMGLIASLSLPPLAAHSAPKENAIKQKAAEVPVPAKPAKSDAEPEILPPKQEVPPQLLAEEKLEEQKRYNTLLENVVQQFSVTNGRYEVIFTVLSAITGVVALLMGFSTVFISYFLFRQGKDFKEAAEKERKEFFKASGREQKAFFESVESERKIFFEEHQKNIDDLKAKWEGIFNKRIADLNEEIKQAKSEAEKKISKEKLESFEIEAMKWRTHLASTTGYNPFGSLPVGAVGMGPSSAFGVWKSGAVSGATGVGGSNYFGAGSANPLSSRNCQACGRGFTPGVLEMYPTCPHCSCKNT